MKVSVPPNCTRENWERRRKGQDFSQEVAFTFNTEHDLASLGFDVVIDEAYDQLGRRISLAAEINGTADLVNTYMYDIYDRMTQVTQAGQTGGNAVAEKRVDFVYDTWRYDSAYRLTQFTVAGYPEEDVIYTHDGTDNDESYTYDANGNRTNAGYVTGDNNRLLSDGTYNYTYDEEGNRLTKTNIATGEYELFEWDHRNRLASVTSYDAADVKEWEVEYEYDAFNRLVGRKFDSNGDGTFDQSGHLCLRRRSDRAE